MTSTFLDYKIYANNLSKSLQRVAADPANATDEKYYEANIGKVTSVDQFLGNYRLFTHAMAAYGLQDLGNAKALMKQVLESNLSDPNSVANRLNDSRYKAFAKAFNFTSKGAVATNGQLQTSTQQQDLINRIDPLYSETAGIESSLSSVTSVSSLESDDGLYTRVLSAFGLSSKTSKSDVTAALESNLSDPFSFANRQDLTTTTTNSNGTTTTTATTNYAKFKAMAEDFNFAADGTIGSQRLIQSQQSVTATTTAYTAATTAATAATVTSLDTTDQAAAKVKAGAAAAQTETDYFTKKIPSLTSVDQLVADPRLVSYVKTAFGLDANMSKTQLRGVLTSNLLDPKSLANTFNVDSRNPPSGLTPYQTVAQAFNIGTDGTAFDHGLVQTSSNITAATTAYTTATTAATAATVTIFDSTDQATAKVTAGATAAQSETDYFTTKISGVTSVTGLLSDSRLVSYIRTAFNLPAPVTNADGTTKPGTTLADLGNILRSNILDSTSAANTLGTNARKLATSFNFAPGGTSWDYSLVQSGANRSATTTAYATAAASNGTTAANATAETAYYTSTMATTTTVAGIVGDSRLVAYIRTAFNLPAPVVASDGTTTTPGTSLSDLTNILNSNLLDPNSAANTLGAKALKLAKAFNIGPAGMVYSQRPMQSAANFTAMTTAYQAQAGTDANSKAAAQTETDYFTTTLPSLKSVDDLLKDKRLVAYITKAYNLPATQTSTLRQVLTSNLNDPKSQANLLEGGYQTLAGAFDISSDGSITHAPDQQVQTKAGLAATHAAYLDEMMETQAEAQDGDGVRLALYFKRVAPTITSAYGILADKALTEVVQTMLGLSASSSNANIDSQAKNITSKLKIADFKDPQKLDKLIARFAALYDITNASSSSSSSSSN